MKNSKKVRKQNGETIINQNQYTVKLYESEYMELIDILHSIPLNNDIRKDLEDTLSSQYLNQQPKHYNGTGNSLFGKITTTTFIPKATRVYNGGSSWTCGDREQLEGNWSPFFEDDTGYAVDNDIYVSTYCGLITNGVLDAGTTPPVGDLLILTHNVGGWQTCTTQVLMKQEMQVFDTKELVVNIPTTASLSY